MPSAKNVSPSHSAEQIASVLSKAAADLTRADVRFLQQTLDRIGDQRWGVPIAQILGYVPDQRGPKAPVVRTAPNSHPEDGGPREIAWEEPRLPNALKELPPEPDKG